MDRRTMLGMVGVGAVGLAAFPGSPAQAGTLDNVHEDCLKACSECARACDETFHHCYKEVAEGKRDHAKPLHYLSDCAGFCGLSACMIAKHSPAQWLATRPRPSSRSSTPRKCGWPPPSSAPARSRAWRWSKQ
jgi:hypothetical protein